MIRQDISTGPPDPGMQSAYEQFLSDSAAQETLRKIDVNITHQAGLALISAIKTHLDFESYKSSLQAQKAAAGALPAATEAAYVQRAQQRLDAFMTWNGFMNRMKDSWVQIGADKAFERHRSALIWNTQRPPHVAKVKQLSLQAGMSEADIVHYQAWLKAHKWDALSYSGAGGSIVGLAKAANAEAGAMQQQMAAIRQHGLTTLEGAFPLTPQQSTVLITVIFFVVIIAICIISIAIGSPVLCLVMWEIP
jgi:hypothetical protein